MKKDLSNSQFARVCNALFGRNNPTAVPDDGIEPLADTEGRLIVVDFVNTPSGFINYDVVNFTTPILLVPIVGVVLWNGGIPAHRRYETIFGFNQHASELQFLHIYINLSPPIPPGAIPYFSIPVPPNFSTYSLSGLFEIGTGVGVTAAPSTTSLIYTAPLLSGLTIQTAGFDSPNPFTYT
jgi:hypothetical protein